MVELQVPKSRPRLALRSVGALVLLSLFWLGVGYIYASITGTGIGIVLFDEFLLLLASTGVGLFIAAPVRFFFVR